MIGIAHRPLISAAELLEAIDDPGIRIADVRWFLGEPERGRVEYQQGHMPGAVFVDLDRDLAAPPGAGRHPLPDPTGFADRMGQLGFGDQHTIVVYDAASGQFGARMWWMLDRLGHRDVVMLDGGLAAWRRPAGADREQDDAVAGDHDAGSGVARTITDRETVAASRRTRSTWSMCAHPSAIRGERARRAGRRPHPRRTQSPLRLDGGRGRPHEAGR